MQFVQTLLNQIGKGRVLVVAGVGLALIAVLALIALRPGAGNMAFLFTDLDPSAAQAIAEKLQAQNVAFQLSADGTAIMAPEEKVAELRMALAGEQLGGKVGYEVIDAEQPFGLSASREKMNETRAIEGELARSIATLEAVTSARVHIVMPDKAIFARESRPATAAVTVKTRGRLSGENIEAIRSLVSAAVPDLAPRAVSIVDAKGRLLARAGQDGGAASGEVDERQREAEERLRGEIETLLEPLVGEGKVRAQVAVEIDRDQRREEARVFDPDKQVIARQISVESGNQSLESEAGEGGVTVGNQLPPAQGNPAGGGGAGSSSQTRGNETSEDTTYDNSRSDVVTVREPGALKRLTVAVMIDTAARKLPAAQLTKLTRIVENAVGFDADRGDSVVVEAMSFAAPAEDGDAAFDIWEAVPTGQIVPFVELLVVAAVGLIVLRIVRGKPARGVGRDASVEALLHGRRAPEDGAGKGATPALDGAPAPHDVPSLANPSHMAQLDHEIALAQVEGGIKASSLKRIGDTILASPAESASVIRQWMNA